ncbi:histidine phosphatase family protein [soil metagenome]
MATLVLVRHGRSTANAGGVLAGRMAGVLLDEIGLGQAERAAGRLAPLPLARAVSSPVERCRQTAELLRAGRTDIPPTQVEAGLSECDYGAWQGRTLQELAKTDLWKQVQASPSTVQFPDGETMVEMSRRSVEAIRRHDAEVTAADGPNAIWLAVSHGDPIKAILADALAMDLDRFQRLHVDPASISVIRYDSEPRVLATNTHEGDLSWLVAASAGPDAAVGGGDSTV